MTKADVRNDRMPSRQAEPSGWSGTTQAQAAIDAHLCLEGPMLPILHALQQAFGFVPVEAEPLIASALNLSRAEVHGVISFYHDFRREPPARHILKLCRAEACQAMGGAALATTVLGRLGVGWGGSTADGAVTVEPTFCLGLCSRGPAAMLDGNPIVLLTADALDQALLEAAP